MTGRLVTAHVAEIEDGSSTELQSKRSDRTCKTLSGIASELATIRGRHVSDLVDRQAAIVTTTTDCLRVAGLAVAEHDSDKLGERQVRAYQDTSTQRQQVNPEPRCWRCVLVSFHLSHALSELLEHQAFNR